MLRMRREVGGITWRSIHRRGTEIAEEAQSSCHGRGRGGTGWETRECNFDAEARRRGGRRGEAAQAKRGRARRQRRMVAFGAERTGFRREDILTRRRGGRRVRGRGQRGFILPPGGGRGGRRNPRPCRSTSRRGCARVASGRGRVG